MQRRSLIKLGVASGIVLAVAAGSIALIQPARRDKRLTPRGREVFAAIAPAVLDATLPAAPAERERALAGHLQRVEDAIAGLPPSIQAEIDELITVLGTAAGRLGLAGLRSDWKDASVAEVAAALKAMSESSLALRQQAFHALRDLTNASYFGDPGTWVALGYPGPRDI